MKFDKQKLLVTLLVLGLGSLPAAYARDIDDAVRRVGNVRWQKEVAVTPQSLLDKRIPENAVSVFFVREQDKDGLQTSANIAINDRFQVSLQPGNYSQVYSCSGINRLSAQITGHKNNDLLFNAVNFKLAPQQAYFFGVDVDDVTGAASIRHLEQQEALAMLDKKFYQTHQISRVVPNCPPEPAPEVPPVVEKVKIELKVLFDIDKSFVKPQYYSEIERAVDYMKRFPDTSVTLEGHTDSTASDEYNIGLSQRRMNAVRKIMIERYGIAPNRIKAVGYGERQPIDTNATPEGRQQNRRVYAVFEVAEVAKQ